MLLDSHECLFVLLLLLLEGLELVLSDPLDTLAIGPFTISNLLFGVIIDAHSLLLSIHP